MRKRVLVLGLDGGTWNLLLGLMRSGLMPALSSLSLSSRWGTLKSTIPPFTAPAWAAFSTGRNPGKTGVYDFLKPGHSIDTFVPISSLDVKATTFPEILEEAGFRVTVINLPTFSDPPRTKGHVLGDMLRPSTPVVQPSSLLDDELFRRYRASPNANLRRRMTDYVDDIRNLERVRFQCAQRLFEGDWDLFFVMFSGTDWIQHELYSDLVSGVRSPAVASAFQFYRDIDEYIGWFVSQLHPEDYLFMVSDHGFASYHKAFSLSRWLAEKGYQVDDFSSRLVAIRLPGGMKVRLPAAAIRAVAANARVWNLSGALASPFLRRSMTFGGMTKADPARSLAFTRNYNWGIYLNSRPRFHDGLLDESEGEELSGTIKQELEELARRGVIKRCFLREELYRGEFVHLLPELVAIPNGYILTSLGGNKPSRRSHEGHDPDGMYLAHGPIFAAGRNDEASIYDLFPTILSLFEIPVPPGGDGKSLVGESPGAGSKDPPASRTPSSKLSQSEINAIEERLRALGYA